MLAYVIFPAMAFAGYAGAPLWVVLFGVAGIATEGWWGKLQRLRLQPWSTKTTAYFVAGIVINFGLSIAGYGVGRIVRATTG